MLCGIRGLHDGDCTYWPESLHSSRSKAPDGARVRLSRDSRRYQSPALPVNVQNHLQEKNLLRFFGVIYLRPIPTPPHIKLRASDFS